MAERRLALALAALLVVAALGFVATAVDDSEQIGGGPENEQGSQQRSGSSGSSAISTGLVVVIAALAVGAIAYATYQQAIPRWLVVVLLASVVVLLLIIGVGYVLDSPDDSDPNGTGTPVPETEDPDPEPTPSSDAGGGPDPPSSLAVIAILATMLVAGAFVVARFTGGEATADGGDEEDTTAVAAAAGRAADELEETTLSNAVYRAWQEMTGALDVENPETTTPAEFEDAAVDAGIDRSDVATLTDLFRAVRYGDAPATPEREQRARETLRRIEETYAATADDSGDGEDQGGGEPT